MAEYNHLVKPKYPVKHRSRDSIAHVLSQHVLAITRYCINIAVCTDFIMIHIGQL